MGRVKKFKKQNKSTPMSFNLDEDCSESNEYMCSGIGCNGCESCILSDESDNPIGDDNEVFINEENENEIRSDENNHLEGEDGEEGEEDGEEDCEQIQMSDEWNDNENEDGEHNEHIDHSENGEHEKDVMSDKIYEKYSVVPPEKSNFDNNNQISNSKKTRDIFALNDQNNSIIRTPPYVRTLFPYLSSIKYEKLMMTRVGLYSISNRHDSGTLTRILNQCFVAWKKTGIVVTDGTAGIGGNSLAFGMAFKRVNAIEWDKVQHEALKCNVNVYGLKNIQCYQGDCMKLVPMLRQHVIFIDPPWGGKSYKNEKEIELTLNDIPLVDIVNHWRKKCRKLEMVAIKIPKNFSLIEFANHCNYPFMYLLYFRKYNVFILSERFCKPIEHRHYTNYVKSRRNSI